MQRTYLPGTIVAPHLTYFRTISKEVDVGSISCWQMLQVAQASFVVDCSSERMIFKAENG